MENTKNLEGLALSAEQTEVKTYESFVLERRIASARDLSRFRALHESFSIAERILLQQKIQLSENPVPPPSHTFAGMDDAVEELRRLQRQVMDMALKQEGAVNALTALEEIFHREFSVQSRSVPSPTTSSEVAKDPIMGQKQTEQ